MQIKTIEPKNNFSLRPWALPFTDGGDGDDTQNFGTVIGIDLGTTYSCVGVMINGKVEIIPNDQGNRRYSDKVVQKDIKLWPFEVINKDDKPYVKVVYQGSERTFVPEEISAMILTKMKNVAEA